MAALSIIVIILMLFKMNSGRFFGYTEKDGPHTWNGSCRIGRRQSPLDISLANIFLDEALPPIHFVHYDKNAGSLFLENNGFTIVVHGFANWGVNQPYIYGGALLSDYLLETIHIHWGQQNHTGSEHTIGGVHYPAELHLVHKKRGHGDGMKLEGDSLAVVAIFLKIDETGKGFAPFEDAIKAVVDNPGRSAKQKLTYNLMELLPESLDTFFTYEGSLTTPNCDEVVIWSILTEPLSVTWQQMELIRSVKITDDLQSGINFRPAQPLFGRKIRFRAVHRMKKSDGSSVKRCYLISVLIFIFVSTIFASSTW